MPPIVALLFYFVFVLGLLRYDPVKDSHTSPALWVPLSWMFFTGSRLPAQWLGDPAGGAAAQAFQEGNLLDRSIFFGLIVLSIIILMARPFSFGAFFSRNIALMALLLLALVSVAWSDFPMIAFKRWFRDLGNYLVVLVVLSDPHPFEAVLTLLRRLFFLLIPLSVVLIKYYPDLGKQFSYWTGATEFIGAATSKNMLGVLCLVSGLFFFWDTLTRWSDRKDQRTRRIIKVNMVFIAMTLWLLNLASSATSTVCLLLAFGFNINGEMAGAVGRDPSLTGRSNIWEAVLSTHTNPIIGTGYESFWLGPRLDHVWELAGQVNEAHNGYLEIYLNLGFVGILFFFIFMVASYRTICKRLSPSFSLASLGLALWTVMLFYNMTESAAFRGQFSWVIFAMVIILVSARDPIARDASPAETPVFEKHRSKLRERAAV